MNIDGKIKELRELRRMQQELTDTIEGIQDTIKAEMYARGTDELAGVDYKVTWKEVVSRRFDSALFKKAHAELYEQYSRKQIMRRFVVV